MKKQIPTENRHRFKKIIILQTAFIGDVILTTPLVRIVNEHFPDSETHFATIPGSKNISENLPYIEKLWIFDKRGRDHGLFGLWRLSRRMRAEKYDLAIVPHRSIRSALLIYLAGIPVRIGFDRSAGARFFTHLVHYETNIHEIERNLKLLTPLQIQKNGRELPDLFITDNDTKAVNEWLGRNKISEQKKFVALAPGSVWPTKRWPAVYWGKLVDKFAEEGYEVILIGSAQDSFLVEEISAHCSSGFMNGMGRFTLRQSAELIRRSQLLVSNDSAPTHMGVAVRSRVLTIFGPTVPAFGFYPYGEKDQVAQIEGLYCRPCSIHGTQKCPEGHFKCMLTLKPDMVFNIARKMLNECS